MRWKTGLATVLLCSLGLTACGTPSLAQENEIDGFTSSVPPATVAMPLLHAVATSFSNVSYINQIFNLVSLSADHTLVWSDDGVSLRFTPLHYTFGNATNDFDGTAWSYEVSVISEPQNYDPTQQDIQALALGLTTSIGGMDNIAFSTMTNYVPDSWAPIAPPNPSPLYPYLGEVAVELFNGQNQGIGQATDMENQTSWVVNGQYEPISYAQSPTYSWLVSLLGITN